MIETMEGMPSGTVGFQATGEVSAKDYREVLEPALLEAAESGEIRMLYLLADDVDLDPGAIFEDAKTGLNAGLKHRSAWKRTAVVTDTEWIRKGMRLFAWMAPGEFRVFATAETDEAKTWIAG